MSDMAECVGGDHEKRSVIAVTPPPFEFGQRVQCIAKSPELNALGEVVDVCQCVPPYVYQVEGCVWSPIGWLVSITGELHNANDFRLVSTVRHDSIAKVPELLARVAELEEILLAEQKAHNDIWTKVCDDNARLRELLRAVVASAASDSFGSIGSELYERIRKELK